MQRYQDSAERTADRLLLLSDHGEVEGAIQLLETEGYVVEQANCQDVGMQVLERLNPQAILLDLERPSVQSLSVCRELRQAFDGPILVLSAETSDVVQILGLEMGADDFLFKPQPASLLLAKLRSFLRRSEKNRRYCRRLVELGGLVVDAARREVSCAGQPVPLTSREFDLLWCLAENARSILSREEIHQALYNSEYNGFDRSIDIYISRIRQKLGDDPLNPRYLKTVRGSGYLLVESPA
ncbi:MAG: response regulator transcription factor [Desulfuromonadaceae bacterium]|nr:response regulator transcription factor [Desulfuromonadaceae bacterium]